MASVIGTDCALLRHVCCWRQMWRWVWAQVQQGALMGRVSCLSVLLGSTQASLLHLLHFQAARSCIESMFSTSRWASCQLSKLPLSSCFYSLQLVGLQGASFLRLAGCGMCHCVRLHWRPKVFLCPTLGVQPSSGKIHQIAISIARMGFVLSIYSNDCKNPWFRYALESSI